jgi:cell division septation protein DedD
MNATRIFFVIIACTSVLLLAGCKGSEQSSTQTTQTSPTTPKQEVKVSDKVDTVNVTMQNSQKPSYEPSTTVSSSIPSSGFSVQIGAHKMQDNAARVAQLAKERFGNQVYTYQDKATGLYKVAVGQFVTKDEARKFRDEMAQRFPGDYKDAWVSENAQK